ncbi:hypothetical protein B0H14DRAFT_3718433 [Mycena olivaceomarginata]|nr:hypothetical protein B0H14DRAFT_3718433 [Mycena olivaceomarginata]
MAEPLLPPELLLEISSGLLTPPSLHPFDPSARIADIATCRALSQSCRVFRSIFLPHLWSRLDVFFTGDEIHLEQKMREVSQAQYLLDYVKTISLSLHGPALSTSHCAAAFLACMKACPNLDAVSIASMSVDLTLLPSVRVLRLPDILAPIISSFPRVRAIRCGEDRPTDGFRLIQAAKDCRSSLEEVCYAGFSRVIIGWIAVATPNIQRLILRCTLLETDFAFMRTMTNLCYLEFAHREATNPGYPSLEECVRDARDLLSISHNPKPKKIYIKTLTGEDTMLAETVIDLP